LPTGAGVVHVIAMQRAFFLRILWLIGLVVAVAGCGSGGKLGGVSVAAVSIRSAVPAKLDTQAIVTLRFTNENVVPVGLSGGKYKLYLNGTYVGQAVGKEALGLPQLSSATQEATLTFASPSVAALLRDLSKAPQASYRIESVLFVIVGEEKLEIKSRNQGAVDLTGLRSN